MIIFISYLNGHVYLHIFCEVIFGDLMMGFKPWGVPPEVGRHGKFRSHGRFCSMIYHGQKHVGVSENVVYPIVPNGFADHYPVFKWLFHWEYTLFSDKPM